MSDDELFEFEHAPHVSRETSKADEAKAHRVIYHRRPRRSATLACDDCVDLKAQNKLVVPNPAVYIRKQDGEEKLLCFQHKQDREDREFLDGPR
jgi:hypothetical protein